MNRVSMMHFVWLIFKLIPGQCLQPNNMYPKNPERIIVAKKAFVDIGNNQDLNAVSQRIPKLVDIRHVGVNLGRTWDRYDRGSILMT